MIYCYLIYTGTITTYTSTIINVCTLTLYIKLARNHEIREFRNFSLAKHKLMTSFKKTLQNRLSLSKLLDWNVILVLVSLNIW